MQLGESLIGRRGGGGGFAQINFSNWAPETDMIDIGFTELDYLSTNRNQCQFSAAGNYAIVGGGYLSGNDGTVDAFNASGVHTIPGPLTNTGYTQSNQYETTVGNYAVFIEGNYNIDAYNASLVKTTISNSNVQSYPGVTSNGQYVASASGSGLTLVNASLVVSTVSGSIASANCAPIFFSGYCIFVSSEVNIKAYNSSFVVTDITSTWAYAPGFGNSGGCDFIRLNTQIAFTVFSVLFNVTSGNGLPYFAYYNTSLVFVSYALPKCAAVINDGLHPAVNVDGYALTVQGEAWKYQNTFSDKSIVVARGNLNKANDPLSGLLGFVSAGGATFAIRQKNFGKCAIIRLGSYLTLPVGSIYNFDGTERATTVNKLLVPIGATGYVKIKKGTV